jgi:hypothetical protein
MQDDFGFLIDYSEDPYGDLAWKISFFFGYGYYRELRPVCPSDNPA